MFNWKMLEMEKNLETFVRILPFLKNKFVELPSCQIGTSIDFNLYAWERRSFSSIDRKNIGSLG
jgi:hypothetical protein